MSVDPQSPFIGDSDTLADDVGVASDIQVGVGGRTGGWLRAVVASFVDNVTGKAKAVSASDPLPITGSKKNDATQAASGGTHLTMGGVDQNGKYRPSAVYGSPDTARGGFPVVSSMSALFSDDFGGSALDATRWDVYDGGFPALNGSGGNTVFGAAQAAIGSGVTGITDSVAASALSVVMPTTVNAERLYLAKGILTGAEDVTVVVNVSQSIAANKIFFGLVEVDPATGFPVLNPNKANDFRNRGGANLGENTGGQTAQLEGLSDASAAQTSVSSTSAMAVTKTSNNEVLLEFHAEDIVFQTVAPDSNTARSSAALRVSSQVPNDTKAYRLAMWFKNVSAAATPTTVNILRVLVVNGQEQRVEIASGRGDNTANKAVAVNLVTAPNLNVVPVAQNTNNSLSLHKLISAASTNATLVKGASGRIYGGLEVPETLQQDARAHGRHRHAGVHRPDRTE
jgi:hypothetical protein